jgi:hypothetical protein
VGVGGEAHVDAFGRIPELGVSRVEVEVCQQRDVFGQQELASRNGLTLEK